MPAPPNLLRQEIAATTVRLVVKVGTRVLTDRDGRLNTARVAKLADELQKLASDGRQVVLVSSGAVGAGLSHLGWITRPTDLAKLQAVAAIGQAKLMEAYDRHFTPHGRHAAQVLLTADDLDHRTRYLNIRNTLLTLLELGAIPIVNENDTVAVEELMTTFGDNDRLAAMVANLLGASLLIILSDVSGLFDGNPHDPASKVIETVIENHDRLSAMVNDQPSELSRGGMASKLAAARMLTTSGGNVIIASGHEDGILTAILKGEVKGTLFPADGKSISPRKRWIGFSAKSKGQVMLDAGAIAAIVDQGRSLLPIGIRSVSGNFSKGDIVTLLSERGDEVARGLSNYTSHELERIRGLRTGDIAERLGHRPYEEAIHRDNLVLTTPRITS